MSSLTTYFRDNPNRLLVNAIQVQDPRRVLLNAMCAQATFLLLLYCIPVAERGNYFEGLGLAVIAAITSGIGIPQNIRAAENIGSRLIRLVTILAYLGLPVLVFLVAMQAVCGTGGSGTLVQLNQFQNSIALAFPILILLFTMIPVFWYQSYQARKRGEL